MNQPFAFIAVALFAYLLGSVPFGYLLVRWRRGQDIRSTGSGNIGATNVARSDPALGVLTLLLDAAKGYAAVLLAVALLPSAAALAGALAAAFAIVGHIFPVWLRFRGGKGVATAVGSFVAIAPGAIAAALALFAVLLVAFRFVSLGSIVAVAAFPVMVYLLYRGSYSLPALATIAGAALLIIARHHQNIRRLLAGTEPRFQPRHRTQS